MKHFTDNTTYNRYLYKIAHSYDTETLEQIRWEIAIDTGIDAFDMANDLGRMIDNLIAVFNH